MNVCRLTSAIVALFIAAAVSAQSAKPAPPPEQPKSSLEWGSSPEALFLTADERTEWQKVMTPAEADAFIAAYWNRHGQAFRQVLLARIAAADKYFPIRQKKGSETHRGRVFIILGPPSVARTNRREFGDPENAVVIDERWTYRTERLPRDLGMPELVINFQIDGFHGYDLIDNPGLVEAYLTRASEYIVTHWDSASATARSAVQMPAAAPAKSSTKVPTDDDVLAGGSLNGAFFSGEAFVSPTNVPFYAVSFFLPKTFAVGSDVIVAAVVRDAAGVQVASVRTPAKAVAYDAKGDHLVDASFQLPPGHYTGAFVIASTEGAVLAAMKNEFDVYPPDHVGMSQLFLTSRIDTFEKQQPFDPFTFVAMKYAVKGDRSFRPDDAITLFASISNPASPQSLVMRLKASKDGKVIDNGTWLPVELTQTGPHSFLLATQFGPGTFKPGHYRLEVRIRDSAAPKETAAAKELSAAAELDVVSN